MDPRRVLGLGAPDSADGASGVNIEPRRPGDDAASDAESSRSHRGSSAPAAGAPSALWLMKIAMIVMSSVRPSFVIHAWRGAPREARARGARASGIVRVVVARAEERAMIGAWTSRQWRAGLSRAATAHHLTTADTTRDHTAHDRARERRRRRPHLVRLGDEREARVHRVVEERGDLDAAARRDKLEDAVRRDQQDPVVGRERVRLDLGLRPTASIGSISRAAGQRPTGSNRKMQPSVTTQRPAAAAAAPDGSGRRRSSSQNVPWSPKSAVAAISRSRQTRAPRLSLSSVVRRPSPVVCRRRPSSVVRQAYNSGEETARVTHGCVSPPLAPRRTRRSARPNGRLSSA